MQFSLSVQPAWYDDDDDDDEFWVYFLQEL